MNKNIYKSFKKIYFMIKRIKENIFQMYFKEFGSCVYLIKLNDKNILIDTSSEETSSNLISDLKLLNFEPKDLDIVILTHNHPDHTGNCNLFLNAKFYASKKDFGNKFYDIDELKMPQFKIIHTPGHSEGSICILYGEVLFSGDTIFHDGIIGRTDFPGGSDKEMEKSLEKLKQIKFETLCPGHI